MNYKNYWIFYMNCSETLLKNSICSSIFFISCLFYYFISTFTTWKFVQKFTSFNILLDRNLLENGRNSLVNCVHIYKVVFQLLASNLILHEKPKIFINKKKRGGGGVEKRSGIRFPPLYIFSIFQKNFKYYWQSAMSTIIKHSDYFKCLFQYQLILYPSWIWELPRIYFY